MDLFKCRECITDETSPKIGNKWCQERIIMWEKKDEEPPNTTQSCTQTDRSNDTLTLWLSLSSRGSLEKSSGGASAISLKP